MKVFLMTVTYLILPPASLLQNDLQKTVLTCTECWEALKPILHVMTNWKEQLDEFSSSVVQLLQRNCISESCQAETKKLLPVAVDLWSGSDWCCIAVNSSRWWNISSGLYYLQIWMMEAEKLSVYIFNPTAVLHCISLSTCSCLFLALLSSELCCLCVCEP